MEPFSRSPVSNTYGLHMLVVSNADTRVSHARWIVYAVVGAGLLLWGMWQLFDGIRQMLNDGFTFTFV